jgi:hypothetical protein
MKLLEAYCKRIKIVTQKEIFLPYDGFICIKQVDSSNKMLILTENGSKKTEFEVILL